MPLIIGEARPEVSLESRVFRGVVGRVGAFEFECDGGDANGRFGRMLPERRRCHAADGVVSDVF